MVSSRSLQGVRSLLVQVFQVARLDLAPARDRPLRTASRGAGLFTAAIDQHLQLVGIRALVQGIFQGHEAVQVECRQ